MHPFSSHCSLILDCFRFWRNLFRFLWVLRGIPLLFFPFFLVISALLLWIGRIACSHSILREALLPFKYELIRKSIPPTADMSHLCSIRLFLIAFLPFLTTMHLKREYIHYYIASPLREVTSLSVFLSLNSNLHTDILT